MKESYKEDLANHFGHESYADDGNVVGVATAVVYAGKLLSSVPHPPSADTVCVAGRQNVPLRYWQAVEGLGRKAKKAKKQRDTAHLCGGPYLSGAFVQGVF